MRDVALFALIVGSASGALRAQTRQCQESPPQAEPFASALDDAGRLFRGTFSADGRTLYYFRKLTRGEEDYRIFVSRLVRGAWTQGQRLDLGGDFSDLYPSVSPDGQRLVFASYRLAPADTAHQRNAYLWYANRRGGGWGSPVFIGPASLFGTYHSDPLIGADYSIRFRRTSGDWAKMWDMETRWNGTGYTPAVERDGDEAIARWRDWRSERLFFWSGIRSPGDDFVMLQYSRIDPETKRRAPGEYWIFRRDGTGWTEPSRAGAGLNDPGPGNFLVFHPNGCDVVFVRDYTAFYRVAISALRQP